MYNAFMITAVFITAALPASLFILWMFGNGIVGLLILFLVYTPITAPIVDKVINKLWISEPE